MLTEFGHQIAPSTYYAALTRPRSERAVRDEELMQMIDKIYRNNFAVYGARKVWWQLRRDGIDVGRGRVERLMRRMGLAGALRGKTVRTTVQDKDGVRAADLVKRQFTAGAPNRLWVADFTYVATWAGTVYVAFAIDVAPAKSSAGEPACRRKPIWCWMRSTGGYGIDDTSPAWTVRGWCIIPTRAANTLRSGSPSIFSTPESMRRSARSVTPWTTRSPNPRSACTRPS